MPHVSGGADVSSNDELKVYHVEGEDEEERSSAENLNEVKTSLVTEVDQEEEKRKKSSHGVDSSTFKPHLRSYHLGSLPGGYLSPSPFGYVVSPFHPHHSNGTYGALPMVNRVPLVPPNHSPSPLSLMMYNAEQFQPPPAHMGIPPVHIDPKTGVPRSPVYPLSTPSQFHPQVFSPDFSQQYPWHHGTMYSMASGFCSPPYPLSLSPANMQSKFSPPPSLFSHHTVHHPFLNTASGPKSEIQGGQDTRQYSHFNHHHQNPPPHHHHGNHHSPSSSSSQPLPQQNSGENGHSHSEKKSSSHIKKPLNAFMLFMKEQRPQVVAECTLKESAAINQILGKKWHNLSREEQSKYYEMARTERQMHMQRYPGWTARDNYAINAKKKKRKRDKFVDGDGNNPKKCRARFGLDQQSSWCKPCRRKKKCIRYRSGSDNTAGESEDNIESISSVGSLEAPTPDSRYGTDTNNLSDNDSGNGDLDDDDSNFSLSSPPVPRPIEQVQSNGVMSLIESPPSQQSHHPLNVQYLSRPSVEGGYRTIPQLPTPPSTDSSTSTALLPPVT